MPLLCRFSRVFRGLAWTTLILVSCAAPSIRAESPAVATDDRPFWERFLDRDVNVITVTDFTPEGKKLKPVSKEHPVYYEALILGYNDWGRAIAGERIPEKKTMVRLIVKVLAGQGYYPCTKLHKPEILLAFAWGSMNDKFGMSLLFMGGDKLDLMWETNPYIGNMLDPRVLTRGMRSGAADMITHVAGNNLYVASIQAFDEDAAMQGKTVKLWHTKISCPADGLTMDRTLRQMVRIAGPMIGRETERPVLTTAPSLKPSIEIGEMKVLETIDTNKLPITDLTTPAAPTPTPMPAPATK